MQADLLITNCQIHTLWDRMPRAETMAIASSQIAAVGEDAVDLKGAATRVIDLGGAAVLPGFIDSHNHLVDYGAAKLRSADLLGSRSVGEIIDRLKYHRERNPVGEWILGHCFDQELLAERRFPTREELDRAFGDVPVLITRVCGHAIVVSSNVLDRIDNQLPEPERQSGILTEGRAALAWGMIPALTGPDLKKAALVACKEARSKGLTGVHVMVGGADEFGALQELHEEKALPVRVYAVIPLGLHKDAAGEGLSTGAGDEWLRIGAVKLFVDGSMGAQTAALVEDFSDDPGNRGELLMTADELAEVVSDLQDQGFQAAVHAIGDRGVNEAASGISRALGHKDNRIHRHRIEHASLMSDYAFDEMAAKRIIACVQPQFVVSDFWTIDRVGKERMRYAYAFKTMLRRGITIAMGSDCPVELIAPFQLIYRAATRDEWTPGEALTPEEAVRAYCLGSAYASFEENLKGSLEPGKLADFVVLSHDILDVDLLEIESAEVTATCVGGQMIPEL